MSLLSKYIIHKSLGVPIMMSNIYSFLMGQAALKHEHIDDYLLMVHCGYRRVELKFMARALGLEVDELV